jgi:ATP-dependent exoDNAse (exonuclease V) alpha subunit
VTKDTITLVTGKEGGKDFKRVELDAKKPLYVALDYASTVHSAQGLTADRVLINLETGSRTTAKDVFYVAISRARHEAVVFTDSLAKLPAAIQRETEKFAALELSRAQDSGKFKIANMLHQKAMQAKEAAGIDGKGALSGIEKALHKAGVGQQGTEKGGPAHNKEKNRDSIGFGQ